MTHKVGHKHEARLPVADAGYLRSTEAKRIREELKGDETRRDETRRSELKCDETRRDETRREMTHNVGRKNGARLLVAEAGYLQELLPSTTSEAAGGRPPAAFL